MEEIKYQVFISSTYNDLIKAREKIIETILRLYHFPVGMEMFSAGDDEQWDVIKDTIDISDYYIIIIGHRYGSETSEGISYTEKEYDYAKKKNIPILAFIQRREVATKPDEREDDPSKMKKLNRFIEKATKSKMCEFWSSVDDLSTKIAIALPKIFRKTPRTGWIRSDKGITPGVSEELARLSKENRESREEIKKLKSRLKSKKPNLDLKFNGNQTLELSYKATEDVEFRFGKQKMPLPQLKVKEPLSMDDIPGHLKAYISKDDIEKYNSELPTEEKVSICNEQFELYGRVNGANFNLVLSLCNTGNIKANEIFVDVIFPPEVLVLEKEDIEQYSLPKLPFPKNPIQSAEEKYKKQMSSPLGRYDLGLESFSNNIPHIARFAESLAGLSVEKENRISISNNKIVIKVKSLLHTRTVDFENIVIVPLKIGAYEIKISLICEEFDKEMIKIMPLLINEWPANPVLDLTPKVTGIK